MKLHSTPQVAAACLAGLLLLAVIMFVAMLVGKEPHPPAARGPYLGAVSALSLVAIWLLMAQERTGIWAGMFALLAFVPAVGPHKFWTEPAAQVLAPLLVVGSLLLSAGAASLFRAEQRHRAPSRERPS